MEVLYNNQIGVGIGGALSSTSEEIAAFNAEQEKKARRSRLFDTLFGIFGKASDVYTTVKYGEDEPKPYDMDVHVGDRPEYQDRRVLGLPPPAGYIIIGVGILIAGVIIYNQTKK